MAERGFVYAATGAKWVHEANASAAQLRTVHDDIPRILYTNLPAVADRTVFDDVITVPEQTWVQTEVKLWSVARSPFERTVYIDTDTYVCADVTGLFDVLARFDFAAIPVPFQRPPHAGHFNPDDIPESFQSVNGGVFSFRRNDATARMLDEWWELFQDDKSRVGTAADQPSLRIALWRSDCRILQMPAEFNMRTLRYRAQPTVAVGPVRIIHGRPRDFDALARRWNTRTEARLLTPIGQYQLRRAARPLLQSRAGRWVRAATVPLRRKLAGL